MAQMQAPRVFRAQGLQAPVFFRVTSLLWCAVLIAICVDPTGDHFLSMLSHLISKLVRTILSMKLGVCQLCKCRSVVLLVQLSRTVTSLMVGKVDFECRRTASRGC